MANFMVIFRNFPEGTEEIHESLRHDSGSPNRDLNPLPHEYEAGVLPDHDIW